MRRVAMIGLLVLGVGLVPSEASALWSRARIMSATPAELALPPDSSPGQAMSPPAISADGRFVAFRTRVRNLFIGADAGLREAANGGLLRREVDGAGIEVVVPGPPLSTPGQPSVTEQPAVSSDGRFIAFTTALSLVAADADGGANDVYVRDMTVPREGPGAFDLVSQDDTPGRQYALPLEHGRAAMSGDGRRVLYADATSTSAPGTLAMRDRAAGETTVITSTAVPDRFAGAAISADGMTVAWVDADPKPLVAPGEFLAGEIALGGRPPQAPDGIGNSDLLWQRLGGGRPTRVTSSGDSIDPACPSGSALAPEIIGLGAEPPRGPCDGPFSQAGISERDTETAFSSIRLSATGSRIAWVSPRAYRGGPPGTRAGDLFIRDMEMPGGRRATTRELTRSTTGGVTSATLDPTGTSAALATSGRAWPLAVPTFIGASLPPTQASFDDVYAMDLNAGIVERVTAGYDGTPASAASVAPDLTAGGGRVAWRSDAPNLIFGDANGLDDVFVGDRFQESSGTLPQEPYNGASGGVTARVFPIWRLSVTVSRGGRVLFVDARVPGAGTLRVTARSRTKQRGRRTQPAVAATTGRARAAGTVRLRLKLRTKYVSSARRSAGLPVRVTVRFTPRKPAGQRSVTTLERVRTSTFHVTEPARTKRTTRGVR